MRSRDNQASRGFYRLVMWLCKGSVVGDVSRDMQLECWIGVDRLGCVVSRDLNVSWIGHVCLPMSFGSKDDVLCGLKSGDNFLEVGLFCCSLTAFELHRGMFMGV